MSAAGRTGGASGGEGADGQAPGDSGGGAGPAGKRRGLLARLILPLVLVLAGAGAGAAGMHWAPGLLPAGLLGAAEGDAKLRRVPKPAPLTYVEIDNSFTANLRDSGRFVQVRIALSTLGGDPVVQAVDRHRPALVAAVLQVLADAEEREIASREGRAQLTDRMRRAINDMLQRKAGIAGIDEVFLVSFVLQ